MNTQNIASPLDEHVVVRLTRRLRRHKETAGEHTA